VTRRQLWAALAAVMAAAGLGGLPPAPVNAPRGQRTPVGVQPGTTGPIVRARQVIVSGANEGVYSYSPTPGAGNLVATAGLNGASATDQYGNHVLAGNAVYDNGTGSAIAMNGDLIVFYGGSLAAGWTEQGSISAPGGTSLFFFFAAVQLNTSATATIPAAPPSITSLGATWNATTATECNNNFTAIINMLVSVGIIT
jgi:hypothetical protein